MKYKFKFKSSDNSNIRDLGNQLQKIWSTTNQSRLGTRRTYIPYSERFIRYLGTNTNCKKIANISNKHIQEYGKYLLEQGLSHKYVKNQLSGVRYLHNVTPDTKYKLMDSQKSNKLLNIDKTGNGGIDRAWTNKELEDFKRMAIDMGRPLMADIFDGVSSTGMRLDEIITLKKSEGIRAIKQGKLHLTNTKGGVPRVVPMNSETQSLIEKRLSESDSKYLFVSEKQVKAKEIHKLKKSVRNFIFKNRYKIQGNDRAVSGHRVDENFKGALTIHGLRHKYARERYDRYLMSGFSTENAKLAVAKELGHGRAEITMVYLEKL